RANAVVSGQIGFLGTAVGGNLIGQHIFGFQKEVYHVLAQRHFPLPDGIKQVLQQMRGIGKVAETAKGARAALDRVRRAKNGIELADVGFIDVQLKQTVLHVGKQLVRLVEKGLEELAE